MRIRRKTREVGEIPLASTADIAFLLIVFYLAASALLEFHGITIPLPRADAPPMQILRENIFRIKISPAGEYVYNNGTVPLEELQEILHEARSSNPDLVVVVRVSPDAPSETVPALVARLHDENIRRVSIGMERGR